jgi:type VI secretion system secreted protein VgrG
MTKFLTLTGPFANSGFVFRSLEGTESLGVPFEYRIVMLNTKRDLDPRQLLGQGCTVSVQGADGGQRHFHGLISHSRHLGLLPGTGRGDLGQYQYEVLLRPHLWFLSRSRDCRIFQSLTVPEILMKVFGEQGVDQVRQSLQGTYAAREYCVQYQETAFDFVSRLMEEVGIYYRFEHAAGQHTLVLCDSSQSHTAAPGPAEIPYFANAGQANLQEFLSEWDSWCEVQPKTHAATDYNFEKPKVDLQVRLQGQNLDAPGTGEYFEFPGQYLEATDGEGLSRLRVEEWVSRSQQFQSRGNARGPNSGLTFRLKAHPLASHNRDYLVRESRYVLESAVTAEKADAGGDVRYECWHLVAATDIPFRSPRRTPQPRITGPQTALVVGPSGQELYCDKYGRVKVQFPWDRLGKNDENSSCWIRVAQAWAGKQWGAVFLPRIGHEVLVEFLDGDPDRPIITGSVYNAELMPPYVLPDNLSQSGVKTHSLNEGTDANFNELRFEDKKDSEQVYLHAERDFDQVIENNETKKVGFEKQADGNQTIEIFNNQSTVIGTDKAKEGNQSLKVWKDQTIAVGGQQTLKIGFGGDGSKQDFGRSMQIAKDLVEDVGNDHALTIKNNQQVKITQGNATFQVHQGNQEIKIDTGSQTVEAGKKIILKVGGSSITITPDGIVLESVKIELKAQANIALKAQAQLAAEGALTTVKASGILTLQGSLTKIN